MQLLPNEEQLISSNNDKIILTTHRVHLSVKEWGRSYQMTMFLENVSSVERLYKSNPFYLILATACILLGAYASFQGNRSYEQTTQYWIFAVGVLFLAAWLASRRHVVTFASTGGSKLNFQTEGMAEAQVEEFIDKVQAAQEGRINELYVKSVL